MGHLKYHLLLIDSTIIIAGSFISAQALSADIAPASLALMRFCLTAATDTNAAANKAILVCFILDSSFRCESSLSI